MAVHTDGTIFAIQGVNTAGVSVIGIDPITGTQKFSVPLAVQPYNNLSEDLPCSIGTVFGPVGVSAFIVAGDGNAYLGYDYPEVKACSADPWTTHVRLLRISSSGAYDKITLADVSAGNYGAQEEIVGVHTITNGDTGVLATWSIFWPGDVAHGGPSGMAIVAGTSVSPVNPPQVPAQCGASVVSPGLQAQDGSFVGTVATCTETSSSPVMVAFDATGNVRWTVPNDQPQFATDDGGVVGQSGVKYDQNGNATGTIDLGTQSWLGYTYHIGSVQEWLAKVVKVAKSWWPFGGGNASGNNAAVLHPPYAQLDSCNDATLHPPPACPAPKDAIFTAFYWLKQRLNDPTWTSAIDQYVFQDTTGNIRKAFLTYLSQGAGPEFYDGPKSNVKLTDAVCGGNPGWTVAHFFATTNNANTCETAVVTCREDPTKPLRSFFEPRAISFDSQGATDSNIAMLFHEALHGFKVVDDPALQSFLGCTSGDDTRDITLYLQQFIGARPLQGAPKTCVYIEQNEIPANTNVCVR